jgi:hypothetical protein
MKKSRSSARLWLMAMLMLFLLTSIGCAKKPPVVVLNESKTVNLRQGEPAPFSGWLLSDGALVDLREGCSDALTFGR